MEKKVVPMPINRSVAEVGAILVSLFGNKKKTRIALVLLGLLSLGASALFAAEAVTEESAFKEITSIEKRGFVNFATSPSEFVYAFKAEKKDHPKAWPLTYVPRSFTNIMTRIGSSAFDILVLPWYVRQSKDDTPLTRRFDLPDYAWEKE